MKAILSFFITGIIMIFLICGLTSCVACSQKKKQNSEKTQLQEQCKQLINENDTLKKENSELRRQIAVKDVQINSFNRNDSRSNQLELLYSIMFSPDKEGKLYTSSEEQKWYSHPYCEKKNLLNGDIILLSNTIISWCLPDGTVVYTCRTKDDVIVYTPSLPYLYEFSY